jgi:hypothetical protein
MAIVIDGSGTTVTFNAVAIDNVNTIAFNLIGDRTEIDLTGLSNAKYETAVMSQIHKMRDIVVNVKSDPAVIFALTDDEAPLVITLSDSNATVITYQAQLKSDGDGTVAPKARTDVDLTFLVTNLSSGAETAPTVTETP